MRASLVIFIQDNEGRPIAGATVRLRKPGTLDDITETIFAGDTGSNPDTVLAQPLQSGTDGKVQVFLDNPRRVDVFAAKAGEVDPQTIPAVALKPGLNLRGAWSNVATYQENDAVTRDGQTWGALRQNLNVIPVEGADWTLLAAKAGAGVTDHGALTGLLDDDHPQYALDSELAAYARKDTAQTFTEDQTIEAQNSLLLGPDGSISGSGGAGYPSFARNAKLSGGAWVRTLADNDAAMWQFHDNGDVIFYTNTDAGTTVGSAIAWGEKFRITKAGQLTVKHADGSQVSLGSRGNANIPTIVLGNDAVLTNNRQILVASGTPEGSYTAPVGSLYLRTDGGAGTSFYVKQSGTGNTGWVGK